MTRREEYESRTEAFLLPVLAEHNFELWDVEYVKEAGTWYLRAYIDKEGGIAVDDCEVISRDLERLAGPDGLHRGQLYSGGQLSGTWPSLEEGEGFCTQHGKGSGNRAFTAQ